MKPGDCIVCFGKNDIYHVSRQLERRGVEVAVIYGTLPPGEPPSVTAGLLLIKGMSSHFHWLIYAQLLELSYNSNALTLLTF